MLEKKVAKHKAQRPEHKAQSTKHKSQITKHRASSPQVSATQVGGIGGPTSWCNVHMWPHGRCSGRRPPPPSNHLLSSLLSHSLFEGLASLHLLCQKGDRTRSQSLYPAIH